MVADSVVFDLKKLVDDLGIMFEETSEKKNLNWQIDYDWNNEIWVTGDKTKLVQVLINLIGNAFKFTHRGDVVLKVASPNNNEYQFSISDTGEGISEHELPLIFNRFQQAAAGEKFGGTGLGLALSFEQIKLMGGELAAQSQQDVGSQFSFKLHLDKSDKPRQTLSQIDYTKITEFNPPINVLIVDDIEVNRIILSKTLNQKGITIITANDGLEAIAAVKKHHIDIIYMDIRIPKMNGQEALKVIRSEYSSRYIPCAAITAANLAHEYEEIMSIGFDGFISKPFRPEEVYKFLVENLDTHIGLRTQQSN
jgi:CheY-like chemotaxis protein